MTNYQILADLGLVVVGAAVFLLIARPLRVPPILAYMVAGVVLGPATGLVGATGSLDLFAELGVALLLFVVGLELSLDKIRVIGKSAAIAGAVQVALTFAAGYGLGVLLGFEGPEAVVVGLVAAFSSTVVVIKLLDHVGALATLHGRLAIGILLVQDVLVVLVLTLLGGLAPGAGSGGASVLGGLGLALLGITGLLVVGAVAGRWILPGLVTWMSATPEGLFVVGLTWAFGFILAAEAVHLSVELGAFIAGVVLAQLPHNEELRRRTHPLVDFFLAVFFVSLGASMELGALAATWPAALAVSAFVLTVKPALIAVLLGALGQPRGAAFLTGLTLGQISEFAFILAGLALSAGLVTADFLGFVGLVGFVTIGASAVLVPNGRALLEVARRGGALDLLPGGREEEAPPPPLTGHVVVAGMNTLGRMLVDRFNALGERVLAVDTDPTKLEGIPARTLVGDLTLRSVMDDAGVALAKLVVSTVQIEDVNTTYLDGLRLPLPANRGARRPNHKEINADYLEARVNHHP